MASKKKIVMTGYYRVSTKAESQKTSFENQPAYFQLLLERPEYSSYTRAEKFYCDFGISGTKLNRPGFKEMLEDAGLDVDIERKPDIPHPVFPNKVYKQLVYHVSVNPKKKPKSDEIWIKSTSRLARNINAYQILETLRLAKVYVFFIDRNLSTRNEEDMPLIAAALQEDMAYSMGLSRGAQIKNAQYRRENRVAGDAYGWIYHKKTATKLPYYTIHPQESEAVLKMHRYCQQGLGARRISKALAAEGILTRAGKPFSNSEISRILRSEKYKGLNYVGKFSTGPLFQKLSSATTLDDYTERLAPTPDLPGFVPEDMWNKTQEILASRQRHSSKEKGEKLIGKTSPRHALADKLVCGYCGGHFLYDNNGGRGYYKCATKRNKGIHGCNCNNVFNYKLDERIHKLENGELLAFIESDFEFTIISLITFIETYLNLYKNPCAIAERNAEYSDVNERLQSHRATRDNLLALLDTASFSKDSFAAFSQKVQAIDEDIKVLEAQLETLRTTPEEIEEKLEHCFEVVFHEVNQFHGRKQKYKKEEILSMLSCIKVYGKTRNNTGGQPPTPILLPVLSVTEQAQGLIDMGFSDFEYRFRNCLPNYEPPADEPLAEINPVDTDIPDCEKEKYYTSAPKNTRLWPTNTSKYMWLNNAYYTEAGTIGYVADLGVDGVTVSEQLLEHVKMLYQDFLKSKELYISA